MDRSKQGVVLALCLLAGGAACAENEGVIHREARARELGIQQVPDEGRLVLVPPAPKGECEQGQTLDCGIGSPLPAPKGQVSRRLVMHCAAGGDGLWHFFRDECATPLVVAFDASPVRFTTPRGSFAVGPFARTEWVSSATPWLARDLDGSGCIEDQRELFGVAPGDAFADGFEKLRALDANGDGAVDASDPAFLSLLLWADANQDRACTRDEVRSLGSAGISQLPLSPSAPVLPNGGSYEGAFSGFSFVDRRGGHTAQGRLVDVYLHPL